MSRRRTGAPSAAMVGLAALAPRRRRRRPRRREPLARSDTTFADVLARFRAAHAEPAAGTADGTDPTP